MATEILMKTERYINYIFYEVNETNNAIIPGDSPLISCKCESCSNNKQYGPNNILLSLVYPTLLHQHLWTK